MTRSSRLLAEARAVIPGGVNSPVRAFKAVGGEPPFIARGEHNHLYDVDGFEYLDLVGAWGAVITGHGHPHVVAAVQEAAQRGFAYGAPTEAEIRLAEELVRRVPSVEMARLVSSGCEANQSAIRLARGYTGRDLIVRMDGCYHGAHDTVLSGSPGVPEAVSGCTRVLSYNDLEGAEALFAAEGDKIAAVLVEPVSTSLGCVRPEDGYLQGLRKLTEKHGALLIFDEITTGFRVARGGAQDRFKVVPDLTTMGKIIGGGLGLASFGGRQEIMTRLAPLGSIYQGGTLSGSPLATAAGLATLELLDPMAYLALEAAGAAIEEALEPACAYHGCSLSRVGALFTVFFRETAPKNFAEARECDLEAFADFFNAALAGGVYLPSSQFESASFSFTLQGDDLEDAIAGLTAAFVAVEG